MEINMKELNLEELKNANGGDTKEAWEFLKTMAEKYNMDVNNIKIMDYLTDEEFKRFVELARMPSLGANGGW